MKPEGGAAAGASVGKVNKRSAIARITLTPIPSPAKPGEGRRRCSPLSRLCGRGDGGEGNSCDRASLIYFSHTSASRRSALRFHVRQCSAVVDLVWPRRRKADCSSSP